MVYKEGPLCFGDSAFGGESTELLPACLMNLLPKNFGAPSLCLSYPVAFWGLVSQDLEAVFSPPCHQLSVPSPPGGVPLPGATGPC
jgi:hypothetical protein